MLGMRAYSQQRGNGADAAGGRRHVEPNPGYDQTLGHTFGSVGLRASDRTLLEHFLSLEEMGFKS